MNEELRNKAVFFDRDGVINNNSKAYYIYKVEDFEINPGVVDALKAITSKGYLIFIITNQGGIAKNQYKSKDVEILNRILTEKLTECGVKITDIYYCPHHSDISKCLCRKPGSILLEKAIARYSVDIEKSYMIGDSARDIEAANTLKIKGLKIRANENLFTSIQQSEFAFLFD